MPKPDNVGVGVAVLLWNHDMLLMKERKGAHSPDTWGFPGGWIDHGESPKEAAVREALEEACVTVDPDDLTMIGYTSETHDNGLHSITFYFSADCFEGVPANGEPEKAKGMGWFHFPNKMPPKLFPGIDQMSHKIHLLRLLRTH